MSAWERFILLILTVGVIGSLTNFYHSNYEEKTEEVKYKDSY